jgi:hypothetical protein
MKQAVEEMLKMGNAAANAPGANPNTHLEPVIDIRARIRPVAFLTRN